MHRHSSYKAVAQAWRDLLPHCVCPAYLHWQAESYRSTEGEEMTIRRAEALNAVLDQSRLHYVPGELLIGIGNLGRSLPAGAYPDETIACARDYLSENIGGRDFVSHADHHAPDYPELLRCGFGGLKRKVMESIARQDSAGRVFLESVLVALDGASRHMRRWSDTLLQCASHSEYSDLLLHQAAMMQRLDESPPHTFHEALQLVLSYHFMMQLDNRYAMAFGRLDQYLYQFYLADLEAGRSTQDQAQDILDHLFAKITVDGDVQNIALSGVLPEDGSDATNELSYMVLEACKRVGAPGGNCTARIHRTTPQAFLDKCAEVIATGIGYPAIYNDEVQIPALVEQGYPLEHSRDYCFAGCIEVFISGKQAPWADGRVNMLHSLNLAVFRGIDSLTGEQVGLDTGEPATFEEFYEAFLTQYRSSLDAYITQLNCHQRQADDKPLSFTSPLMSALVDNCIERGRDVNGGGALYPANFGLALMGVGTVSDALCSLKKLVFEEKLYSMEEIRRMLLANFEDYAAERSLLEKTPKFGNDDDEVDALAHRLVCDTASVFSRYRTPQGGHYWALLGANVQNISAGRELGATPDGRLAGTPVSDASSPHFGRDKHGPTATIKSIAKLPYHLCLGGNVVNMKISPDCLHGLGGLRNLTALVRTCFDLGGIQLQFNTTNRQTLIDAMEHPEDYGNLVVRVSGFSARFVELDRAVMEDVLARTEHAL